MAWTKQGFVDRVTKFTAAVGNNIELGIEEAKAAGTSPSVGGENTVTVGTKGQSRKVLAVIVGNGAATKFKIKHGQNTFSFEATQQTGSGGKPSEVTALSGKIVAINAEEVEVTYSVAPAAKEERWWSLCL